MEARAEAAVERAARSSAWVDMVDALPDTAGAYDVVAGVTPVTVHPSHNCVYCGGFVGCLRCGAIVAVQSQAAISRPCRGYKPEGSRGAIRRLVRGLLPQGQAWPNSEGAPQPQRYDDWVAACERQETRASLVQGTAILRRQMASPKYWRRCVRNPHHLKRNRDRPRGVS